jgi:hypothetical protein
MAGYRGAEHAPVKVCCAQRESRISQSIHQYHHQFELSRPRESENIKGQGNSIDEIVR